MWRFSLFVVFLLQDGWIQPVCSWGWTAVSMGAMAVWHSGVVSLWWCLSTGSSLHYPSDLAQCHPHGRHHTAHPQAHQAPWGSAPPFGFPWYAPSLSLLGSLSLCFQICTLSLQKRELWWWTQNITASFLPKSIPFFRCGGGLPVKISW